MNIESLVRYFLFYALILGTALALLPASEAEVIKVKKYTSVSESKDLFLIDLVERSKLSEDVLGAIEGVKITNGPRLGEKRILSNRSLSKILRKSIQKLKKNSEIQFQIPSQVVIENLGKGLSKESAKLKLQNIWKSQCAECEFKIEMLNMPKLPPSQQVQSWRVVNMVELPKGSFSYELIVTSPQGTDHKYWLNGQVRVLKPVLVTTRHMAFGQTLRSEDVRVEKRDVTFAYDRAVTASYAVGKKLKRSVTAGFVIWEAALERPLSVRRGHPVKLVLEDKDWSLTVNGIAQGNGQVGDIVSVRNPSSDKLLSGKVTGDGEVVVQ